MGSRAFLSEENTFKSQTATKRGQYVTVIYVREHSAYVFGSFTVFGPTFRSLIHLSLYLGMVLDNVLLSFFYM